MYYYVIYITESTGFVYQLRAGKGWKQRCFNVMKQCSLAVLCVSLYVVSVAVYCVISA